MQITPVGPIRRAAPLFPAGEVRTTHSGGGGGRVARVRKKPLNEVRQL